MLEILDVWDTERVLPLLRTGLEDPSCGGPAPLVVLHALKSH